MSLAYCYYCLENALDCDCEYKDSGNVVYGELRVAYLRGYRDAEEGREEDLD